MHKKMTQLGLGIKTILGQVQEKNIMVWVYIMQITYLCHAKLDVN